MPEPKNSASIQALRVAQSELVSGDTSGKVFLRLSDGACAFLTDRSKAQDHISQQIRETLLKEEQQKQQGSNPKR